MKCGNSTLNIKNNLIKSIEDEGCSERKVDMIEFCEGLIELCSAYQKLNLLI